MEARWNRHDEQDTATISVSIALLLVAFDFDEFVAASLSEHWVMGLSRRITPDRAESRNPSGGRIIDSLARSATLG